MSILMLATAILGLLVYFTFPAATIVAPDSAAYARFDPVATATYPLFLRWVGIGAAPLAQLTLFTVAAAVLVAVVYREFRSILVASALLLALFINPEVNRFHATALSESLFLSVDILFIAAATAFVAQREAKWAVAAAALAALGATIRPISMPLIAALIVMIPLVLKGRSWRAMAGCAGLCILAWISVVGAERTYSHFRHGAEQTSLTGPHLFAKSVLIEAPVLDKAPLSPLARQYAAAAETGYSPVRHLLARAKGTPAHSALRGFYQVCIQHGCTAPIREAAGVSRAVANKAMLSVALARISREPGSYLALVAEEYTLLWALNTRTHPSFAAGYDAFVQSARPLPFENRLDPNATTPTSPSRLAYVIRPVFIAAGLAIGAITLLFPVAALRGKSFSPLLLLAIFSALCVQFVFAFTAMTGLPEGRYTMGMWPHIAFALLFALAYLVQLFWGKRRARSVPLGAAAER
jgi:hypothetical protein